jgi:enoyl-[acyl-carrier protein] reductase I
MKIFNAGLASGKFDASRKLSDGSLLEFAKIYPLDASFDNPEDIPPDIRENKRYKEVSGYTVAEVVEAVKKDFGQIDILIHSLANAPEVQKPLLDTSRKGYLAALSSSSYSFISLLAHFSSIMPRGSSALSLTYIAAESVIPGYGGGMSSAKAALESDTRTLAFEAGRRFGIRVNAISAGPYGSRAAKAIGFIEKMIEYTVQNSPLGRCIEAKDVANAATFLVSDLASAITGEILHVDCGQNVMGIAVDSQALAIS